ncbi:phosphonate C-P lyase system protein PhnH [Fulvimarina sp. MAC3]|uniref:phosphonate C-P lyase system protein PhnH n=1 Tax=Fulvimarina sp. MAC3 TaxID=3148887 RepID=UPI0031FD24F9
MSAQAMSMSANVVEGGFSDPVFDAQSVFSSLLRAMSRPGEIARLDPGCAPPAPLSAAQGAILLALADAETPVFIGVPSPTLKRWLAFHTGARLDDGERADYAVVQHLDAALFDRLPLGTLTYPDRSATVLCEVGSLTDGPSYELTGPGIDGTRIISPRGLSEGFAAFRTMNRALFPCGLDLVLTCGPDVLALPRSTTVREV